MTLRALLGDYVGVQAEVIIAAEPAFRAGTGEVHATRVAVRRLRSTLRTFGVLLDLPRAGQLEEELVWWASLLGTVRDLDIMERRLEQQLGGLPAEDVLGPVAAHIATEIQLRRRAGLGAVLSSLDSARFHGLLDELHRWRNDPPFVAAADRPAAKVAAFVERSERTATRRLDAGLAALRTGDPDAPDLLHRARKAVKRHRYAVEAAEPVLGGKAAKVIRRRKHLQETLGEYQDSVVTAPFLRELGARTGVEDGHNGFTYGLLYARELAAADQLLDRLKG